MRPIACFFSVAFGLAVTAASAADYKAGPLDISDPWSRATPKGSSVAAGYMKIKNNGSTPDRLMEGSSDVASKFEVHEMKMENGVAKMRPIKGGLEIKPGENRRTQARLLPRHVCWFEETAQCWGPFQGDTRIRKGRHSECRLRCARDGFGTWRHYARHEDAGTLNKVASWIGGWFPEISMLIVRVGDTTSPVRPLQRDRMS